MRQTSKSRRNFFGTTRYSAALGGTYSSDKERKQRIAEQKRQSKKDALEARRDRLQEKKLQAQERALDAKLAAADRKIASVEKKIGTAEKKVSGGQITESEFERIKARMEKEIESQERHKAAAQSRNPAWGYGVYQPGFMGETQLAHFKSKGAAETWARSSGVTGYKVKRAFAKNPRKNPRNPVDSAAALSESWHGRPAKSATEYQEKFHYHGVLTDLGRLKEVMVMVSERKGQCIIFDAQTRLASSENGKQLYVVGGDQSIDLKALGITGEEAAKDLIFVGEVHHLVYITAKMHLAKADKETGPYQHLLGEDSGVMPILLYDTLNQKIGFAGGNYFIDPTDYDGRHSAGIRD